MIVNNKFRQPVELIESVPIKKNYDFYKTTGNLWDSKYLTSPKIARYYHNIQDAFLSGPKSPEALSLQDSRTKSQEYSERAKSHQKQSQLLLKKRKNERLQITSTHTSSLTARRKAESQYSTPKNTWESLNAVPVSKLRHVVPSTIIEKDKEAIEKIFQKTSEIDKMNQWFESEKQNKRLRDRLSVIKRHNELRGLEEKCGIIKIREKAEPQGIFGYVKVHKVRARTLELSKPHSARQGGRFDHQDFRGLLHADHSETVEKVSSFK